MTPEAVPAPTIGLLTPRGRHRGRRAAPWMAMAVVSLLAGLWAGLVLLGLPVARGTAHLPGAHGPLMALAFLGTLISLERAVALGQDWAFVAPAAAGLGGMATIVGAPLSIGPALLTVAGLGLVAIFVAIYRIQPALHTIVMSVGAACWPMAGVLWVAGEPVTQFVPWLAGFLVLTIAGERLDLSRMVGTTATARRQFVAAAAILVVGLLVTLISDGGGIRLVGVGMLALAAWLGVYDIARRTVRGRGVTRFMAVALLLGYGWLAAAGALWLEVGALSYGAAYDAMLHAVFLGFVMSMVFAHAPVIVPAVLRVQLSFHPISYVHLGLLHGSLLLRLLGGDLAGGVAGDTFAWQLGGILSEAAILLFVAVILGSVLMARGRRRRIAVRP